MRSEKSELSKIWRLILFSLFNVIAVLFMCAVIEGAASIILFIQTVMYTQPIAEASHTEYDEELGWVNLPNVSRPNMYGPGVYVTTNSQGFRNRQDFSPTVPSDKIRLICSGDSFTFGYGVDNEHTWCHLLAEQDSRLQGVNMGQGGYGVDQAYLWYKRDGTELEHDIHLFAFITNDFQRMQVNEFVGYGKPLLKVIDDELTVTNVPVPPPSPAYLWLVQNRDAIVSLKSIQLVTGIRPGNNNLTQSSATPLDRNDDAEQVAAKLFQNLQELNESRDSVLVLVYLPTLMDYDTLPADTELWRERVQTIAEAHDIILIDLLTDFRELPGYQVQQFFITPQAATRPEAAGHYTATGNAYIAEKLYEKLLSLPPISDKLKARETQTVIDQSHESSK